MTYIRKPSPYVVMAAIAFAIGIYYKDTSLQLTGLFIINIEVWYKLCSLEKENLNE